MLSMFHLEDHLRAMVDAMPRGSSVTLPVDWLRVQLGMATAPIEQEPADLSDLSVEEVAVIVDRKPSTVRGWCSSGHLDAYRLNGREWRISREALQSFLDRQRAPEPREEPPPQRARTPNLGAWRSVGLPGAA